MAAAVETKQKTDAEVKAAAEPPKELEEDAKRDSQPKIAGKVAFLTPDTTMNVMTSTVGGMLVPLTEGGLSQLVAGARANVGVKSGRHMFEAKIVEQSGGKAMVRVGFSAEGSLFLGEDDNSICFESDGHMVCNKKKTRCGAGFGRDMTVAVVLNLDDKSPNANTISFFKDGKRVSQPQQLPEDLKGKTLFPSVSFKNATVNVNFGAAVAPLPFTCKSIQQATTKDAVITKYEEPADGKYSVLFPVGLPDEGTFDGLDYFLAKNPSYTEISDRAFNDWAMKSGLPSRGKKESNDKPGCAIENVAGCKKTLMELASMQPRNFVIMEVKGNLIKEDRLAALTKFKNQKNFKCVADVMVSEPPSSFQRIVRNKTLEAKQKKSDIEHKAAFEAEKRKWAVAKRTKDLEKHQKQKAKETKKKIAEAKKIREAALKKAQAAAAAKKAAAEGKTVEEEKEEEPVAEVESDEEVDEPMEPEPTITEAPKVSLTADEKAVKFYPHLMKDLAPQTFAASFTKFSLPTSDEFDLVKYSWAKETEAAAYTKSWILGRKLTTRVEDIVPSASFKQKSSQWQQAFAQWKGKNSEYKASVAKKAAEKQAKAQKKAAAERLAKFQEEKKAKEEEAKAKAKAEGKEVKEDEKKEEEKAPVVVEEEEEEPEPELDFDNVDVFGVEDILDLGNKVPLFRDFQSEDFVMMNLRVELHLLAHSFCTDCDDPDRTGIHVDHLAFYYQKYFGKALNVNSFGVKTAAELAALVDDTILVKDSIMQSVIPSDLESNVVFAKITEACRRHRHLMLAMGEESFKLKISGGGGHQQEQGQGGHHQQQQGQKRDFQGGNKGGKGNGWGGGGGWNKW